MIYQYTRKVLKQINLYHSPVKIWGGQSIFYDQLYHISIKVFDFLKEKINHVNLRKKKICFTFMENQKSNLICSYWIYNYSIFQVYIRCIKNNKQIKQFDTDIPFTIKNKERRIRESTFIPLIDLSLLYRYLNQMASCNYIIKKRYQFALKFSLS